MSKESSLKKFYGTREAYGETLVKLGRINRDIVVLDADLSGSTKTSMFAKEFPDRFFNMGVAEQNLIGTAAGLAASGKTVFVSTFAVFLTGRAWEQVRQSVSFPKQNVKLVSSHGGITVGPDGASHQSTEDISLMRTLANMKVVIPADAYEVKKVVEYAANFKGPIYIRCSRDKFPVLFDEDYVFELGKGKILRDGKDATIFACGIMVSASLEAASVLEQEGIDVRVVNMSSLKPIDEDLIIRSADDTGAIITAEEHSIIGGLGSAVAEILGENRPTPMIRVGIKDRFGMSGSSEDLLREYGLTATNLVNSAKKVLEKKGERVKA
ncbi:MAG: transketolase [Candidatus Schekmanbacteria bacterium RBG_16_38_11]|uniref:Transketolase n=2 Tax=Candidatus Schekmaniibacteriota TaxID=1817811 RepID=A0A1F7R9X8_9BACT|nr:MAG: transketolase [Candidatus Schekmanbacteria bacterium GWA2_38_11]OGL43884.1 MAG: transketolase [Candidatus Schekmanbacteria bacterium RBG_16_38_11]